MIFQQVSAAVGVLTGVQKALDPNDPQDYVRIVHELQTATKGLAGPAEAKALRAALNELDVDWSSLSADARSRVLNAAKAAINSTPVVLPRIEARFSKAVVDIAAATKKSAAKKFKLKITPDLSVVDRRVLKHVASSQGLFVRNSRGKRSARFSDMARKIVADGLKDGLGRADISAMLSEKLARFGRDDAYWDLIASTFSNRARTYANMSALQEAGIKTYTFHAVRDERTSEICRFMHGRSFNVSDAVDLLHDVEALDDPEDIKGAQPWVRSSGGKLWIPGAGGRKIRIADVEEPGVGQVDRSGIYRRSMSNSKLSDAGIMMPPLHGHCRSTVIPGR